MVKMVAGDKSTSVLKKLRKHSSTDQWKHQHRHSYHAVLPWQVYNLPVNSSARQYPSIDQLVDCSEERFQICIGRRFKSDSKEFWILDAFLTKKISWLWKVYCGMKLNPHPTVFASSRGRVVKASDSKSDSFWERRFESYRLRFGYLVEYFKMIRVIFIYRQFVNI